MLWCPKLHPVLEVRLPQAEQSRAPLPQPDGRAVPEALQGTVGPLAAKAHCWLMISSTSTRNPRSLSVVLLSCLHPPSVRTAGAAPSQVQNIFELFADEAEPLEIEVQV